MNNEYIYIHYYANNTPYWVFCQVLKKILNFSAKQQKSTVYIYKFCIQKLYPCRFSFKYFSYIIFDKNTHIFLQINRQYIKKGADKNGKL